MANNLQTGTDFSVNRHLKAEHAQKKTRHGDELDTTAVGPLRRGGVGVRSRGADVRKSSQIYT